MSHPLRLPSGLKLMNLFFGGWTVLVFGFLYIPIVLLVVFSFNDSDYNLAWEGFTTRWYEKMANDRALISGLKNSLIIASITTVLAVALGTLGAWLLFKYRFPLRRLINTLIFVPMVIPEVIMGISLLILYSMTFRWLDAWQQASSGPEWFSEMSFGLGYITVIIAHVTFCFPFVLVAVQARLSGVDPALEEAAMDLGATPGRAFWHVMVPYMLPAIISGALMSFTLSMDEVIVTVFTSGPESKTLPLVMFDKVRRINPSLNAISAVVIVATIALVLISEWLKKPDRAASKIK
jgi:spermidine/putrescine transport system permease protein